MHQDSPCSMDQTAGRHCLTDTFLVRALPTPPASSLSSSLIYAQLKSQQATSHFPRFSYFLACWPFPKLVPLMNTHSSLLPFHLSTFKLLILGVSLERLWWSPKAGDPLLSSTSLHIHHFSDQNPNCALIFSKPFCNSRNYTYKLAELPDSQAHDEEHQIIN